MSKNMVVEVIELLEKNSTVLNRKGEDGCFDPILDQILKVSGKLLLDSKSNNIVVLATSSSITF